MAVQARNGVYALLLGSGVSRPAQIPTGYELMCDLIRRVAQLSGTPDLPNPEAWFREKFGIEPTYCGVLEGAAHSRADRSNLLRRYFVPTEEERMEGKKVPTKAHCAIARMARSGHFKVAVTTNFDPLLEQALAEAGVARQVVASPDAVRGMTPVAHADFTVVKVHGDYLDLATSNTAAELASYDPEIDALLDEVFTNYGLLVCGWSGEWDEALRKAIVRNTRHRFGTYWMTRGELVGRGEDLASFRAAQPVRIESADEAFEDLEQKLFAINEHRAARPLSAPLAMAQAKLYLAEPSHLIRLDDLVRRETKELVGVLDRDFRVDAPKPENTAILGRVERAEAAVARLAAVFAAGGRWGSGEHRRNWKDSLEALARFPSRSGTVYEAWKDLRYYPACLVLYAGGLATLTADNYANLTLLLEECMSIENGRKKLLSRVAAPSGVLRKDWANQAFGTNKPTPMSDRIAAHLAPLITEFAGSAERYEDLFDMFEFLLAMACADHDTQTETAWPWIPLGRFVWNCETGVPGIPIKTEDITAQWPPLAGGMFGGDLGRSKLAHEAVRKAWSRGGW